MRTLVLLLLVLAAPIAIAPTAGAGPTDTAKQLVGDMMDCVRVDPFHVPPVYTTPC